MLTTLDWIIILFYFAVIAGISWWAVKKKDKTSADDYFLAGRHLGWFVVGASIFACRKRLCKEEWVQRIIFH